MSRRAMCSRDGNWPRVAWQIASSRRPQASSVCYRNFSGWRYLMSRANQKGIALVMTLILIFLLSVMSLSLMFISQTETWSSLNYRLTSQARDGAEAGINSAANYIVNSYTEPGGPGDP